MNVNKASGVDPLGEVMGTLDEDVLLLNPSAEVVGELITETQFDLNGTVDLIIKKVELNRLKRYFTDASELAQLANDGKVRVSTLSGDVQQNVFLTESKLGSVITLDESFFIYNDEVEYESSKDELVDRYTVDGGDTIDPLARVPSRNAVEVSLKEEFGEEFYTDFISLLKLSEDYQKNDLDEESNGRKSKHALHFTLLITASKHNLLLYDVGQWGENVGLLSKATVSRVKKRLEENNLLETEPVVQPVGRPRQRLSMTEQYDEVSDEQLVEQLGVMVD